MSPSDDPIIRNATSADLSEITAIYGHHVLHGTGTFEEIPPTESEMAERFAAVAALGLPWIVVELGGIVQGYAYSRTFNPRSAYRFTVENAVYVRDGLRGKGLGRILLRELISRTRAAGKQQIIALITSGNEGSIQLHKSLGFRMAGELTRVGFKFNKWHDVAYMQLDLNQTGS